MQVLWSISIQVRERKRPFNNPFKKQKACSILMDDAIVSMRVIVTLEIVAKIANTVDTLVILSNF